MNSFSGFENSPAFEDDSPCRNCAWFEHCQKKSTACGRFLQYVETGRNNRRPILDKELRLKELAGGDLPTHYTRYWSRPNRYIYYKIFAGELREDLEVLFQGMTQVEAACLLSMPVKTMVYRLKKWGIDRDDK